MNKLFHVTDRDSWIRAKEIGHLPAIPTEFQDKQVDLNLLDSVEAVAAAYFEPEEEPITLEIDTTDFMGSLHWSDPTEIKPWKHATVNIESIPLSAVTRIFEFKYSRSNNQNKYALIRDQ